MATELENDYDYSDDMTDDNIADTDTGEEFSDAPEKDGNATHESDDISNEYDYEPDEEAIEDDDDIDADDDSSDNDSDTDDNSSDDDDEPQQIDQALIFEAAQAGLSIDQVSEIKDPAALRTVIEFAKSSKPQGDGSGGEGEDDDADAFKFEPIDLKIPEDFDEEGAELMQNMSDSFNSQMKAMTDKINEQDKARKTADATNKDTMEEQARNEFYGWFDKKCESMKEWSDVLGKGEIKSLSAESAESKNRVKIVREMDAQLLAHPELINDKDKLLDRAMLLTFPDQKEKKSAQAKRQRKTNHQHNRGTQRPSGKRNRSVSDLPSKKKSEKTAFNAIMGFLGKR